MPIQKKNSLIQGEVIYAQLRCAYKLSSGREASHIVCWVRENKNPNMGKILIWRGGGIYMCSKNPRSSLSPPRTLLNIMSLIAVQLILINIMFRITIYYTGDTRSRIYSII